MICSKSTAGGSRWEIHSSTDHLVGGDNPRRHGWFSMNDLADKEFQVASAALENCRRYIAAHKTQRWDAVKWGVSVNLALAVAAAIPALAEIQLYLLVLSCGVTAASWLLVLHYNKRVAGIRKQVVTIIARMKERGVDYDSIVGQNTKDAYSRGEDYDIQELILFMGILAASIIPVLLSLIFFVKSEPTE
jgi:hypothetical protein